MKKPAPKSLEEPSPDNKLVNITPVIDNRATYDSSQLSQKVLAAVERKIVFPPPDIPQIRAIAISSGRAGETQVREIYGGLYKTANAELGEETRALLEAITSAKAGAERQKQSISKEMDQTDRYLRVSREGTPWTRSDRIKVQSLLFLSGVLLLVGINSNALVLMASGLTIFESPWRAYTFSLVPIGLAAGLKSLVTHLETRDVQRWYIISVWCSGLLAGVLWAILFARTFPGLTQNAADIVNNLANSSESGASSTSNGLFVFCAMLAESCLAAGCWLTAQTIAERHQMNESSDNPIFQKLQKDLDFWSDLHSEHQQLLGRLNGKLSAIENAGKHYLESVTNLFRVALKDAANNQHLNDYLNS